MLEGLVARGGGRAKAQETGTTGGIYPLLMTARMTPGRLFPSGLSVQSGH